jgi:hypothetical protein
MWLYVQVFGRWNVETILALCQLASEKRQGRKSRSAVRRALWGIGGESWGAELGLERLRQWVCGKAWMGASV